MSDTSAIIRCSNCLQLNRVPLEKLSIKSVCANCKAELEVPREPLWAKAASFDRLVAHWPETLLVVFTAQMCLHCKIVEPVLHQLARERAGKLKIMKVDIETDAYLAQRFKVEKTPTFLVYKNAVEIIRVDGPPKEKTDLVKWVDNLISFTSY